MALGQNKEKKEMKFIFCNPPPSASALRWTLAIAFHGF